MVFCCMIHVYFRVSLFYEGNFRKKYYFLFIHRLIYWTEYNAADSNNTSIYRLTLDDFRSFSTLLYNGTITSALTEDTLRKCLYVINHNSLQIIPIPLQSDSICYGPYQIENAFSASEH